MNSIVHIVTLGALLHDIGNIFSFTGTDQTQTHSNLGADFINQYTTDTRVIDCIKYHHRQVLEKVNLDPGNPAYILSIADQIAMVGDSYLVDAFQDNVKESRLLKSIFNLLNDRVGIKSYWPRTLGNIIYYPEIIENPNLYQHYSCLLEKFKKDFQYFLLKPEYINALIELLESCTSYIPAYAHSEQVSDISLYDHSKLTAALAACIALYLENKGITNFRDEIFYQIENFFDEKVFCLLSLDTSGIQQFIYTISSKGALKGLRARSFYLEIMIEHIVNEILNLSSLSRANLLYAGGGHAYILLPNTEKILSNVEQAMKTINRRLMKRFGTRLFIAYGLQSCSANEFMTRTCDSESYFSIFRSVSAQISEMKLRRYSADDIRMLNGGMMEAGERECSVCGSSSQLNNFGEDNICEMCSSLADISNELVRDDFVLTVMSCKPAGKYLPLISSGEVPLYLKPMALNDVKELLCRDPQKVVHIYSKNTFQSGLPKATRLWMGDYASKNDDGSLKTFEELAKCAEGIKRIAVLRADVDNLGASFIKGFVRETEPENKFRYVSIARTSTLSRSLSMFFKYHINHLMERPVYSLTKKSGRRDLVIVYSGGDDLFIVGAWDEVLSAAVDIQQAFDRYTDGALSLSAGFSLFPVKYPISLMAKETADLEDRAKQHKHAGGAKNAISLFGLEPEEGFLIDNHTYSWKTFIDKVLGEKYQTVQSLFDAGGDYGSSFLYQILYLLKQAEKERINIARLAYMLARHQPDDKSEKLKSVYKDFSVKIHGWVMHPDDRKQLITAIMLYIYAMRENKEGDTDELS